MDRNCRIPQTLLMAKDAANSEREDPTRRAFLGEWLERAGITAAEVSRKTGIGESHLSLVKSGSRGLSDQSAVQIAKVLGIEFWQLFAHPDDSANVLSLDGLTHEQREAVIGVADGFRLKNRRRQDQA